MKKSVFLAIAIAAGAALWMGYGVFTHKEPEQPPNLAQRMQENAENADENSLPEVRIKDMNAQSYIQHLKINGRTKAGKKVQLSGEIAGRITEFPFNEGDSVKEGDVIARIDIKDRRERLKEAQKLLAQREIEYNAAKSLETRGFNSRISLAQSASALETARAGVKTAQDEITKTTIIAPFDGILSGKMVEIGDYLSMGQAIITLAQLDPLEVTGFVTEHNIRDIEKGTTADILLRGQKVATGTVKYTSSVAEQTSRTFEIELVLPNPDFDLVDGLTVEISIPLKSRMAYEISPSVLTLGDGGQIGVKLVNDDNIVSFHPIEMLSDTSSSSWIGGLPEQIRLITLGQNFVSKGTKVKPVAESPSPKK